MEEDYEEEDDDEEDDDLNLLAMQMQKYRYKAVSVSELWMIWSLVDSTCYDVNGRDNLGVPPILYAAMRGSVVLLRLLLNYHADINAMSKIRETAVIAACRKHQSRAAAFLIKRGALLDVVDRSQFSALRWATTHADVWMVKLLLKYNVSVSQDSYTTNSALSIAMSSPTKHHAKIALLLQRKLVAERQQLLQDVIKRKERDEIRAIKRYRRKMLREKAAQPSQEDAVPEPQPEAPETLTPTPFSLPIIPSLKKKPFSQSHVGAEAKKRSQAMLDASPIHQLLSVQFAPLATKWTRVGTGKWCQVAVSPKRDRDQGSSQSSGSTAIVTPIELMTSEAAWDGFIQEKHTRPASRYQALEVEDLD